MQVPGGFVLGGRGWWVWVTLIGTTQVHFCPRGLAALHHCWKRLPLSLKGQPRRPPLPSPPPVPEEPHCLGRRGQLSWGHWACGATFLATGLRGRFPWKQHPLGNQ